MAVMKTFLWTSVNQFIMGHVFNTFKRVPSFKTKGNYRETEGTEAEERAPGQQMRWDMSRRTKGYKAVCRVEHECGARVWSTSVEHKHGSRAWSMSMEHERGAQTWSTSVEH
ncbi:hypothetical protein U0070_019889 [Myodes glareolus]|uniref:Uncharacterized protein n=1 Tax=Myodes glareolus TaxID=447135 RepID=A0AAW0JKP6_MYOGA